MPDMLISGEVALGLVRLTCELTERQIIQEGVDIAQAATSSKIAYLHFLNDDQDTLELGVWSRATRGYCTAIHDRHYPVSSAGIWADSARHRRPCLHNDYAATTGGRGLPDGHSTLVRHLGLPVIDGERVRMLIGVGNKATDYDEADVAALDLVARRIWSLVRQRRLVERLLDVERRFVQLQEVAAVCGVEYDVDDDRFHFDHMFAGMFGTPAGAPAPRTLDEFVQYLVEPRSRAPVVEAFTSSAPGGRSMLRVDCIRRSGERFPAELKLELRRRELGPGLIVFGIVQDMSEQFAVENLRRHADTDALTGLPNRRRLEALFEKPGRRGGHDGFALHYVDLDDFKPVNDTHGHAMGDEVLRALARRLQLLVRKDDLVVRLGGDEFVVVQTGLETAVAAEVMADKIIAAIGEPIDACGHTVQVGASIGITYRTGMQGDLDEVAALADRALYLAKAAGGRCWRFATDGDPTRR